MPTEALNEIGTSQATTGTGAVAGTIFAVPQRNKDIFVGVQISFSADPGAYVFSLQGSLDGTNFAEILAITGTTVNAVENHNVSGLKFVRLNQTSKANAVTANAILTAH